MKLTQRSSQPAFRKFIRCRRLYGWLNSYALIVLLALPASAQSPGPAPAKDTAQKPQISATWTDWDIACKSSSSKKGLDCQASRAVILNKTRQLLLKVTVSLPAETKKPVMLIQMPNGLYLPSGVQLGIDDGTLQPLVLQTCDNSGCYSGSPVSGETLAAMKSGSWLKVSFLNLQRKNITVALPLDGFLKAYEQMEAR